MSLTLHNLVNKAKNDLFISFLVFLFCSYNNWKFIPSIQRLRIERIAFCPVLINSIQVILVLHPRNKSLLLHWFIPTLPGLIDLIHHSSLFILCCHRILRLSRNVKLMCFIICEFILIIYYKILHIFNIYESNEVFQSWTE